jgi:hypothetical protein
LASSATAASDGGGPVGGRDAGGDAAFGLDGNGEPGFKRAGVVLHHHGQVQLGAFFSGQRQADQAPAVFGHEVDGFGGHLFRRHGQVPFVFPVFIVDEDDHFAIADIFDGLVDGNFWHGGSFSYSNFNFVRFQPMPEIGLPSGLSFTKPNVFLLRS